MGGAHLRVATLLWDPNPSSRHFSRCYDESWVEKLYAGFRRNLTVPFTFVCYTDRQRSLSADIVQACISAKTPTYADCLQPYEMGRPMILVGLDTLIIGNIDHLAEYCLKRQPKNALALPRDPYAKHQACNGVALVPEGYQCVWRQRRPGFDDMEEVRRWAHVYIDDLWPGQVISWKGEEVFHKGPGEARIVYFHGNPKMHEVAPGNPVIEEHWRL